MCMVALQNLALASVVAAVSREMNIAPEGGEPISMKGRKEQLMLQFPSRTFHEKKETNGRCPPKGRDEEEGEEGELKKGEDTKGRLSTSTLRRKKKRTLFLFGSYRYVRLSFLF